MPNLHLEISAQVPATAIKALQTGFKPHGTVYEEPALSRDPLSVILGISFVSDVLQGVDVLVNWLQATPRANKAVIRFSDGRTLRLQDTDPEAFRRALKAALK